MKKENIEILKSGGVGVIPTDTVYGLACSVFKEKALERMFTLKGRAENKPPVVLIGDISDLEKFDTKISLKHLEIMKKYWPGELTIIFEISSKFKYLDQGLGLAVRLPNNDKVLEILKNTGPLATTSANLQGQPLAKNIMEAKKYFDDRVDFYEDWGELDSSPSTLIRITDNKVEILRSGVVKLQV
jgi:L-threonylcarbamoyladenylate synthase